MDVKVGVSRRAMLLSAGASGALAIAAPLIWPAAADAAALRRLTRASFVPVLHKTIKMTGPNGSANVVLSEINDSGVSGQAGSQYCFSLVFDAPLATTTSSGVYSFSSFLGTVKLFATPTDKPSKTQRYQAVVNNPR